MKNALILHGAGNNHTGNWFPWLKNELGKKGYRVWVPDLPNAEAPDIDNWLDTVFSNKEWTFDGKSVIIGHSAGATLILRILERLNKGIKIEKAVLVAGFVNIGTKPEYFVYKKGLLQSPFDWNKIKASCNNFNYICSDNDRYQCGKDQAKIMLSNLGGELILERGEDHFNLEKGAEYIQFPLILKLLD